MCVCAYLCIISSVYWLAIGKSSIVSLTPTFFIQLIDILLLRNIYLHEQNTEYAILALPLSVW